MVNNSYYFEIITYFRVVLLRPEVPSVFFFTHIKQKKKNAHRKAQMWFSIRHNREITDEK